MGGYMFKNIYPVFERKRLLKIEMLNNMRDFPREMFQILSKDISNGIVAGAELKVTDRYLIICPGILIWCGIVYMMEEELKLPYEPMEKMAYLKVKFMKEQQGTEGIEYLTSVYIDDTSADNRCELELGRYKLLAGAKLRDAYTDYDDYSTEYDTLNRIHVPFASAGRSTIWSEILKVFAVTMMKYDMNNPWDCAFCLQCLQLRQGMPYEEIKGYLNARTGNIDKEYSNLEIYQELRKILYNVSGTIRGQNRESRQEEMILLI